ncbi:MAG: hypothetical protein JWM58_488 [Rhizobium sp.]|nr:hypothetical protein [Rhizobium sp.]
MFSRYGAYYLAQQTHDAKLAASRWDTENNASPATPTASQELAMFLRLGGVIAVFSAALACMMLVLH